MITAGFGIGAGRACGLALALGIGIVHGHLRETVQDVPRPSISVAVGAVPIRIEWLDIDSKGTLTVTADRAFAGPAEVSVAVTPGLSHWIRLTPEGKSPVTLQSVRLSRDQRLVPPVLEGGELVISVQPSVVRPSRYRLQGPAVRDVEVNQEGFASVPGLPPGSYSLVGQYSAGYVGPTLTATITQGKSTVRVVEPDALGAIELVTADDVCSRTSRIQFAGPSGARSISHEGNCNRLVDGLKPGRYVVSFSRPEGSVVVREGEVTVQKVATLRFESEFAALTGSVTLSGRPADGLKIYLANGRTEPLAVPVQGGSFSAVVGEPGRYIASIRDMRRSAITDPIATRTLDLGAGTNQIEWSIDGGTITLTIQNWTRASALRVQLRGAGSGEWLTVDPLDQGPIRIVGLKFAKYELSAVEDRPSGAKTSRGASTELTAKAPEAEVVLDLSSAEVTLVLRDEANRPVRTSIIDGKEIREGVYVVPAHWGESIPLRVPGYSPACRVAHAENPVMEVVLRQGRALVIDLPGQTGIPPISYIPPGSDCGLSLHVLNPSPDSSGPPGTLRVVVQQFPVAGPVTFVWRETGTTQVLTIPANGPLVLKR